MKIFGQTRRQINTLAENYRGSNRNGKKEKDVNKNKPND